MYANPPSPANKRKRAEKEGSKPKKKRRASFGEGTDGAIPFVVGQVYLRQHIHEHYGGSKRGGISMASYYPYIFLFAHSKKSKSFYYFRDGFQENNTSYIHTTIGREGDLNAVAVNAAIKDHQTRQKKVLLFSHPFNNGHVRYLGEGCYKSHKILTFLRDKQERLTSVEFTFVVLSEQTAHVDARALVSGDLDDESDSQEADASTLGRVSLRHSDSSINRVRNSSSSDELRRLSVSSSEYERALSRKSSSHSVNSEFSFDSSGEQTFRSGTMRSTDSSDSITHLALQLSIHDSDGSPSIDDSCSVLTPSTANDSAGVESDDMMLSVSSHSTPCTEVLSRPGTPAQPAGTIVLAPYHGVSLRSSSNSSTESRTAHLSHNNIANANTTSREASTDSMDYIATMDNNDEMFLREEMFLQEELDNLRRGEFNASTEPTTDALFERYIQELASSTGTDIFDSFNFDGIFGDSFPSEHHL